MMNSTFSGNNATKGGALNAKFGYWLSVEGVNFVGNNGWTSTSTSTEITGPPTSSSDATYGGAVYMQSMENAFFDECTFAR